MVQLNKTQNSKKEGETESNKIAESGYFSNIFKDP